MAHITLTIYPDGTLDQAHRAEYKRTPGYPILKSLVGGYIETVPHLTTLSYRGKRIRCTAYVDEEGQLKSLPRNNTMTEIWKTELLRQNPRGDFWYEPQLYGPVVLVINANQLAERSRSAS